MDSYDRLALYYETDQTITNLYNKSKDGKRINNIWRKIVSRSNIRYAIRRTSITTDRSIVGPDGLSINDILKNVDEDTIIRNTKKRLHGKIKPGSVINENKKRKNIKFNIYDLFAQQAIFNIIEPIVEGKYYNTSFGGRRRVGKKECLAMTFNTINNTRNGNLFRFSLDDSSKIDANFVLDSLRHNFNIYDTTLLNCMNRILKIDNQDLINKSLPLGNLFLNILFYDLDYKINSINDVNYHLEKGHKNPYQLIRKGTASQYKSDPNKLFSMERNRRTLKLIRYNDECLLYTNNQFDIYDGIMVIEDWFKEKGLQLNEDYSRLIKLNDEFRLRFLGYKIRRNKENMFLFSVEKQSDLWKRCKYRLNKHKGDNKMISFIMLSYFYELDFTTNPSWFIRDIRDYIYRRTDGSRKINRIAFKKVEGKEIWNSTDPRSKDIKIDPWSWRKFTKKSIKEYSHYKFWDPNIAFHDNSEQSINSYISDFIKNNFTNDFLSYKTYLPSLINGFKGYEPILHEPYTSINPNDLVVHHILPRNKGGKTEFSNLVVLHKHCHDLITGYAKTHKLKDGWKVDNKKLEYFRKKANK